MLAYIGLVAQHDPSVPLDNVAFEFERLKAFSEELQYRQHENLVKQLGEIHKKLAFVSKTAAGLAVVSVILAVVDVDHSFEGYETEGRRMNTEVNIGLNTLGSVLTAVLVWSIVKFHRLDYERLRTRKIAAGPGFRRSPQFRRMIWEVMLFFVHCPPTLNTEFSFHQLRGSLVLSLAEITTVLMFTRLWLLLRGLRFSTTWGSLRVEDTCVRFGCHSAARFMLKAYFQSKPFLTLIISLVASSLVFGLIIRILERPYAIDNGSGQDYGYIWNAFWLVIITMFTIGYGDFYPQTHLGRVLVIIACIWGMFLVSMLVVQLSRATLHTQNESRAFDILTSIRRHMQIEPRAAKVILSALQYNHGTGTYSQILTSLVSFRKVAFNDDSQASIFTHVHLTEEKIKIDIDELGRISKMLREMERKLMEVERVQVEEMRELKEALVHTEAALREIEGSEVEVAYQ